MQKGGKEYKIKDKIVYAKKGNIKMNFHDKKVKRLISILIIVIIVAMVGTMILPSLM